MLQGVALLPERKRFGYRSLEGALRSRSPSVPRLFNV